MSRWSRIAPILETLKSRLASLPRPNLPGEPGCG